MSPLIGRYPSYVGIFRENLFVFCCLFSNAVMLGLPITERAYGKDALQYNFAIVSIHAPFCYFLGITVMELVKSSEESIGKKSVVILKACSYNKEVII